MAGPIKCVQRAALKQPPYLPFILYWRSSSSNQAVAHFRSSSSSSRLDEQEDLTPDNGLKQSIGVLGEVIEETQAFSSQETRDVADHPQAQSSDASNAEDLVSKAGNTSSTAAYLYAQVALEEAAEKGELEPSSKVLKQPSRLNREPDPDDKPWTGDEPIRDAVLRMLVDKYKPLRVKGWEKKRQEPTELPLTPPIVTSTSIKRAVNENPHEGELKKPLNPWEVTFRAPSHQTGVPQIRQGRLHGSRPTLALGKAKPHERVMTVREAVVDRRLGLDGKEKKARGAAGMQGRQPMMMPGTLKGFLGLADERIELARQQGAFKNLKGRGKPFEKDPNASNPFVGSTDYLMNRLVQRQGAAPPWVELQQEMESRLVAFRTSLKSSWTRRAIRILSLEMSPLRPKSNEVENESEREQIVRERWKQRTVGWRDGEWEKRERSYHEASVDDANSVIRKYNALAPYHVRRPILSLHKELSRCFTECEPEILDELVRRSLNPSSLTDSVPHLSSRGGMITGESQLDVNLGQAPDSKGGAKMRWKGGMEHEGIWTALKRAVGDVVDLARRSNKGAEAR